VAVGSDGTSYAVWQDSRNGNADIFFSTLSSGGATWAANVKISDDTGTTAQTKPRIGIDSAGTLIVAWIDARTSPARIRVARKPAAGGWTASVEVSPSPANVQALALSVRADGYAWVTWGDIRAGATNSDIWGSRYDALTKTWSAPQRLDDATGTTAQLNPTVAFTATETMFGWRDNRLNANGDTQARRVDHFTLSYDGLNRLKAIAGPVPETFTFDEASNILTRTGPSQTDTYDEANRLTSDGTLTYTWSDADRLSNRGSDLFGYDALDRLTSSTVSGTARTYTFNGDGLLQSRTQGTATSLLWDPSSAVSRLLKLGANNIVYGLGPLYAVQGASTVTFARDGSKNVRAEVSSTGAVNGAWRYRGYGQIAASSGAATPSYFGLANELLDPSGLYYMRARWYDPAVGRFLSRDPLKGKPQNPVTLNAYMYAAGDPIAFTDPTGLDPESDEDPGVGCQVLFCNVLTRTYGDDYVVVGRSARQSAVVCGTNTLTSICWIHLNAPERSSAKKGEPASPDSSAPSGRKRKWAGLSDDQLKMTNQAYISAYRAGWINREFPGEWKMRTVLEALETGPSKVRKLLIDQNPKYLK
jgi:RHS repeat-associated protein